MIYVLGAIICLNGLALAKPVIIKVSDLDFLFLTLDPSGQTVKEAQVMPWDSSDGMAFFNIVSKWPDKNGIYYGTPSWYTNMSRTAIPSPDGSIMYAAMVDLKAVGSIRPLITKWKKSGDFLELLCVSTDFPEMSGAVHFEDCRAFPDSSLFLLVRSGGGNMETVWTQFSTVTDDGHCKWIRIHDLTSTFIMFKPSFTESWCQLDPSGWSPYSLTIYSRHQEQDGPANADGSYNHKAGGLDSTFVDLWKETQKVRSTVKK